MSLLLQSSANVMCQREVHVVAAEQQVVADGETLQTQFSVNLVDRHQRQVGRAATDINHQQHVAGGQHVSPIIGMRGQPAVNGCLRFFQQHEVVGQTRFDRRLASQLPGRRVKRSGNGQHHLLIAQRRIGVSRMPSGGQVRQESLRAIESRYLGHFRRRLPRQHRLGTADTSVTEPTLGRHDNALRILRRLLPRIVAGNTAGRIIDQRCFQRFDFAFAGQIQERWKRNPRFDLSRPDQLGNRQQLQ